jgi:hypothetical protein
VAARAISSRPAADNGCPGRGPSNITNSHGDIGRAFAVEVVDQVVKEPTATGTEPVEISV